MSKIRLMIDSACDLTHELCEKNDIKVLPVTIMYNGSEHKEYEEIDIKEYWDVLETSETAPSTAQISPAQYIEAFEEAKAEGYTDVICLVVNAAGSGTYNSGIMARDMFYADHGEDMKIHMIDSQNYSYAYGSAMLLARRAIDNGAEVSEVIDIIKDHCSRVEAAACVFTLKYLKKSGRVSGAAAIAGEFLGIKPIIHLCSCGVDTVGKVRGEKPAVNGLLDFVDSRMDKEQNQDDVACVLYANTSEEYIQMVEDFLYEKGASKVARIPLGASILTNTGPNIVGIVYYGKKRA